MAAVAVAAGDTTCAVLYKRITPRPGQQKGICEAWCRLTIDPGTDDLYKTGGILLTNMFTSTHGTFCGIDVAEPVWGQASMARNDAGVATFIKAYFYNGGTTAAAQTLVLTNIVEAGSTAAIQEAQLAGTDLVTFMGSANDLKVDLYVVGTEA